MIQGQVLLLNGNTWEPLAIIDIPRAMNLIFAGKAFIVEESGRFLRSVRQKFAVPSVIALKHYVNVPRRRAPWSRKAVLSRDNYCCIYCGIQIGDMVRGKTIPKSEFTIDHLLPRSRGGKDTWSNTACACSQCNHRKGNRTPDEAGMKLRWEPRRPRTSYLVLEWGGASDSWKRYIDLNTLELEY